MAIKIIQDYEKEYGLKLNKSKCGILIINKKTTNFNNFEKEDKNMVEGIPFVKSYKYLGVDINKMMNLDGFIVGLVNKVSKFEKTVKYR